MNIETRHTSRDEKTVTVWTPWGCHEVPRTEQAAPEIAPKRVANPRHGRRRPNARVTLDHAKSG